MCPLPIYRACLQLTLSVVILEHTEFPNAIVTHVLVLHEQPLQRRPLEKLACPGHTVLPAGEARSRPLTASRTQVLLVARTAKLPALLGLAAVCP